MRLEPFLSEVPAGSRGCAVRRRRIRQRRSTSTSRPRRKELLAAMHEKTRYNARLAARKGVVVRTGTSEAYFGAFLKLMDETASRDAFVQHDRGYLRSTWKALSPSGMARLRIAEHGGCVGRQPRDRLWRYGDLSLWCVFFCEAQPNGAYAMQWEAIRAAKGRVCLVHDGARIQPTRRRQDTNRRGRASPVSRTVGVERTFSFAGTWDIP